MLRLPEGLEVTGRGWFRDSDIEKVVVSSSVTVLGDLLFMGCKNLREVVFEPDSHLRCLKSMCFAKCGLKEIVIPKSVRVIGDGAFYDSQDFSSLRFEDGSQLSQIGMQAFNGTNLDEGSI